MSKPERNFIDKHTHTFLINYFETKFKYKSLKLTT